MVCRAFSIHSKSPRLWSFADLAYVRVTDAIVEHVSACQPLHLDLRWSTVSTGQVCGETENHMKPNLSQSVCLCEQLFFINISSFLLPFYAVTYHTHAHTHAHTHKLLKRLKNCRFSLLNGFCLFLFVFVCPVSLFPIKKILFRFRMHINSNGCG